MRAIPFALESLLKSKKRIPAYKLYAYNPAVDSYTKVITQNASTTPIDITENCSEISWSMTELSFTLKDKTGDYNPDTGVYKDYLSDGCILRLKEGDIRLPESEWLWTFTGAIKGQLGWLKNRKNRTLEAKVTAYSRENTLAFKRRKMTSKEYTVGTDMGIMFADLAEKLGLTAGEVRVPGVFGTYFTHKINQVSQITPWDAFVAILEVMMQVPIFDGEGKLSSYRKNMNRPSDITFNDESFVHTYEVVSRTDDAINKVIVTFLDSNLTKVEGPNQKLGDASITTGFFTFEEKLKCFWSEDRKQRASGTVLKVIKGVNDNLLPVGTESYAQNDEYSGTITITVSVWVPTLATAMLIAYVALAWIPDGTVPIGSSSIVNWPSTVVGAFAVTDMPVTVVQVTPEPDHGWTIPWGRVGQAAALIGILAIMMSLGSAQYEIWGFPYDMAYIEKRTIAIVNGTEYYEECELNIKNDFIGIHNLADMIAACELTFQVSKACPRKLVIDDFLGLEIGDIIQIYDGRKVFILDMKKTIKRGQNPTLEITGFKVRTY
jgi:hypothetical protein